MGNRSTEILREAAQKYVADHGNEVSALAKPAGVDRAGLARFLSEDTKSVSLDYADKLARGMGTTLATILGGEPAALLALMPPLVAAHLRAEGMNPESAEALVQELPHVLEVLRRRGVTPEMKHVFDVLAGVRA